METAMEERKDNLEKLEMARDELIIKQRKLEQSLKEKDNKVEVSFDVDLNHTADDLYFIMPEKNYNITLFLF